MDASSSSNMTLAGEHEQAQYTSSYAAYYDLFYADKAYAAEAQFAGECIRRASRRPVDSVLDVACGTGRHACELAMLGFRVTGADIAGSMLDVARNRAAEKGLQIPFRQIDMTKMHLFDDRFDAVTCFFDSIGYGAAKVGLDNVLISISNVLKPGGVLLFEFWHAEAMLSGFDPLRVRRWSGERSDVVRISETSLDHASATATVAYEVIEMRNDGTYLHVTEKHTNQFFEVPSVITATTTAGLEYVASFAGFQRDNPIDSEAWHIVTVVRKPE